MSEPTSELLPDFRQIIEVRVPVTWPVVLFIVASVLTLAFWISGQNEIIKFVASSAGLSAAVLSAIYVGKGLEQNLAQRREELKHGLVAKSFHFMERWNDPKFNKTKVRFSAVRRKIGEKNPQEIEELLQGEEREATFDILNFLEEVALSANLGLVDASSLERFYKSIVIAVYGSLSKWIGWKQKDNPRQWRELRILYHQWSGKLH